VEEEDMRGLLAVVIGVLLAGSAMAQTKAGAPNDAQIASIAVTANQVDIDAAKLALGKTQNAEVKKFAELMVADHTSVIKKASDLAGKLKLTPEDNDTSKALKKGGEDANAKLMGLSGAEFDKAYVANEVAYHKAVLDALDKALIPNAKNAELKKLLESVRPVIAGHLAHAEGMAKSFK
jgi:putative membrane protein